MRNKCDVLESSWNHTPAHPQSLKKLSSTKPVPGAKKVEDHIANGLLTLDILIESWLYLEKERKLDLRHN